MRWWGVRGKRFDGSRLAWRGGEGAGVRRRLTLSRDGFHLDETEVVIAVVPILVVF